MSSKAITEKPSDLPGGWTPPRETAPSLVRQDEPQAARMAGMVGLTLAALGTLIYLFSAFGWPTRFGTGVASVCVALGLACMLFHASRDRDLQFRRSYGVFGSLWLVAGLFLLLCAILVPAIPIKKYENTAFFPYGFMCLGIGLFFVMAFIRTESEASWRDRSLYAIGGIGVVLSLAGFIGSNVRSEFLLPYGLLLAALGCAYLWVFLTMLGPHNDLGYLAGLGLGGLGLLFFLIALGRSSLPPLFHSLGWLDNYVPGYFKSSGLILMVLSLAYVGMSASLCSENAFFVLFRRELGAFFYSPVAYIVLFSFTIVGWVNFLWFVWQLWDRSESRSPIVEPIVREYIISIIPALALIILVPILTMRLLSEEKRTGTLEVLLTAPLNEPYVVLSKFFAAWIFFLLLWLPWGLFLIALRMEGEQPFEYRPLISFFMAQACSGAAFVSMGLFFSALTRNQVVAAILGVMGMMILLSFYFFNFLVPADSNWKVLLTYFSFIHLWMDALSGKLVPRNLLFHLSACVFWLFLSVKVLEARKWT